MKGDTYKETIHDGPVSYSVTRISPPPGTGKHAKTLEQVRRRHYVNVLRRMMELDFKEMKVR